MSMGKAFDEIKELLQLSERVAGIAASAEKLEKQVERRFDRMEAKIDDALSRLKEIEIRVKDMKGSIKSAVLADIRAETAAVKTVIGLLPQLLERVPELRHAVESHPLLAGKEEVE